MRLKDIAVFPVYQGVLKGFPEKKSGLFINIGQADVLSYQEG